MIASVVTLVVAIPPAFFLWTTIHELAHLFAAKWFVNAKLAELRVWPHVDPVAGFRWGSVRWTWTERPPTDGEYAAILFAPRLPDLVAAVCFPCLGLLPVTGWVFVLLSVLVGAGLVDFANGSIGRSSHSDLRRAAEFLKKSPWLFRVAGWACVVASAAGWLVLSLDQIAGLAKGG